MDYKKGYEQYKGKCERLEKKISEMEERQEGWMQLLKANDAIVAGVLVMAGADADNPMRVEKDTVSMALGGRYVPTVRLYEEDKEAYYLFYEDFVGAEA